MAFSEKHFTRLGVKHGLGMFNAATYDAAAVGDKLSDIVPDGGQTGAGYFRYDVLPPLEPTAPRPRESAVRPRDPMLVVFAKCRGENAGDPDRLAVLLVNTVVKEVVDGGVSTFEYARTGTSDTPPNTVKTRAVLYGAAIAADNTDD